MSLDTTSQTQPRTLRSGARVAMVVSRYHADVTGAMADSAAATLAELGLDAADLLRVEAPGAFELPIVARRLAERPDVDCVLCFGLVLKGETEHDRYIAHAVSDGLMRIGLETGTPALFGVLTCNTLLQAQQRARTKAKGGLDKGREVAEAAAGVLSALSEAAGVVGEAAR